MDEQRPDTSVICNRSYAAYGVSQQGRAQFYALRASIHRKPCEHHHRHRVRHVAPDGTGGFLVRNCPRRQSVIPKHASVGIDHHEGTAGPV